MSVSTPWTNTTPGSTARLNEVTVISDTGTNLAALDKTKHRVVFCTSTGGGLTVDHLYLVNAAEDAFIDLGAVASHNHSSSSEGGAIDGIFRNNPLYCDLWLTKTNDLLSAQWIGTAASGGTVENNTDGTTGERSIRLRTNTTSGGAYTIAYPHLQLDFTKNSFFQTKLRIETATNMAFHCGIQCDNVTEADSNTAKLQAEFCTTTNNNWWLRTGTGSAQSASDTGVAITTSRAKLKIEHFPATPNAYLYVDADSGLVKTTNIPTTGVTADNNLIKHSVKNSTTADRPIHIYGSRLSYTISDEWR